MVLRRDERVRTLVVERAGEVRIGFSPQGVRIVGIAPAAGWKVDQRVPRGLLRRRRPSDFVCVNLRQDVGDREPRLAEVEVARLPDGDWEAAREVIEPRARLGQIDLGAGAARVEWDGSRLELHDVRPAPGWVVHDTVVHDMNGPQGDEGLWEVVVIWRRGREEVELLVQCDEGTPAGYGWLDVDRRERFAAGEVAAQR